MRMTPRQRRLQDRQNHPLRYALPAAKYTRHVADRALLLVLGLITAVSCSGPATPPPAAGSAAPFPAGELVDLSHTYDQTTIFWPTPRRSRSRRWPTARHPAGFYYSANNFSAAEHGGTHLDAPVHFAEGRWRRPDCTRVGSIAPAVVIDVAQRERGECRLPGAVGTSQRFEQQHGAIPRGSIVLLRTGFAQPVAGRAGLSGDRRTG